MTWEEDALCVVTANAAHFVRKCHQFGQDAADTPNIGSIRIVLLHDNELGRTVPTRRHLRCELPLGLPPLFSVAIQYLCNSHLVFLLYILELILAMNIKGKFGARRRLLGCFMSRHDA